MKIISWNIAGRVNRIFGSGGEIEKLVNEENPHIIALQETKSSGAAIINAVNNNPELSDYKVFEHASGNYSGTAFLAKKSILEGNNSYVYIVKQIIADNKYDVGRLIVLKYNGTYIINAYIPNAGVGLVRLDFKCSWLEGFTRYLNTLRALNPDDFIVIIGGDLNVANSEIDLARPKPNYGKTAGYTPEEINGFNRLKYEICLTDTFRYLHPTERKYSFFSDRCKTNRERNVGWRLDYFLTNAPTLVKKSDILDNYMASDHLPILLDIDI